VLKVSSLLPAFYFFVRAHARLAVKNKKEVDACFFLACFTLIFIVALPA
jgi:hypothetical protein